MGERCAKYLIIFLLFGLAAFEPASVHAAIEKDFKLDLRLQTSLFSQSGKGDQEDGMAALEVKPDLAVFFNDSAQAVISPRFRLGLTDPEYHLISPDDVYMELVSERFEIRAGYQTFFWGTVESENIVDILNQDDFRGDFVDPQKLGEPALRLRVSLEGDRFDLFYIAAFTPAELPGPANRFHFFDGGLDISDDPLYTSSNKRARPQFAFRWERTLGSADMGLSYFNGYEKFPVLNLEPGSAEADTLYYEMQQAGFDLQMSLGNWLIKSEAVFQDTGPAGDFFRDSITPSGIVRMNLVPEDHRAWAGGVEYTFFGVVGNSDLGVILEYLYDSEQDPSSVAFRPFQNDVFAGLRWVRNNTGDGEVLAGLFHDLRLGSSLWRVEYSERYFDRIKVEGSVDLFNADEEDPLAAFNNEDRFTLTLSYTY